MSANFNGKYLKIKQAIKLKYGTVRNFAEKAGYHRMYVSNVLNKRNPMTNDFKEVLKVMLGEDIMEENKNMPSKILLDALFESSSLRQDLLDQVKKTIYDLFDSLVMNDEVLARVSDETYEFIKNYKN